MKVLYKTFLICSLLLAGSSVYAQYHPYWNYRHVNDKVVTVGVRAGMQAISMSNVIQGGAIAGFKGGVTLDFNINDPLYFQSGLDFTMKGAKGTDNGRLRLNYLQLPLHIAYKPWISDNARFVVFGGGYLAYGVGGNALLKDVRGTSKLETKPFKDGVFKSFDGGISFGFGFEVSKFVLTLGTEIGLTNISDLKDPDPNDLYMNERIRDGVKTRSYYMTVGYQF